MTVCSPSSSGPIGLIRIGSQANPAVGRARPTLKTSEAIDSHKFFARKAESNSREK